MWLTACKEDERRNQRQGLKSLTGVPSISRRAYNVRFRQQLLRRGAARRAADGAQCRRSVAAYGLYANSLSGSPSPRARQHERSCSIAYRPSVSTQAARQVDAACGGPHRVSSRRYRSRNCADPARSRKRHDFPVRACETITRKRGGDANTQAGMAAHVVSHHQIDGRSAFLQSPTAR